MSERKKLREEYNSKVKELQDDCPHKESEWKTYGWAPGHPGGNVKVCKRCEKVVERARMDLSDGSGTYDDDTKEKYVILKNLGKIK